MSEKSNLMHPRRSPKAGRPPEEIVSSPRVRRRQKTAVVFLRKGTTLLQSERGPRVLQAAKKPKVKKG